jgi:Tfp pilus assembly protein PilO
MALKKREKIMVGVAVLVVLYFAVDFLLISPMQKEIKKSRHELNELEEKLSNLATTAHSTQQLKGRVQEKERFLDSAKGRIVGQDQIRFFLNQLAQESKRLNFEIVALRISREHPVEGPKKEEPGQNKNGEPQTFTKIVADVTLNGSYGAFRTYLNKLEDLPLFMEMGPVTIVGPKEGGPMLQMNFRPSFLVRQGEKTS